MTIDDKISDQKLQYDLTEKQQKCQHSHVERLLNMNNLHVKKYCLLI